MEYETLYYFSYIMKQSVIIETQGIISVFRQTQSLQTILIHLNEYKVYKPITSQNYKLI